MNSFKFIDPWLGGLALSKVRERHYIYIATEGPFFRSCTTRKEVGLERRGPLSHIASRLPSAPRSNSRQSKARDESGRRCSWNRRQYGVAAANTHAGDFEMAVHVAALRWGAAPVDDADGPEDATSPGVPTPRGFFD